MTTNTSPLAQEYANSTETALDHAHPGELERARREGDRKKPERADSKAGAEAAASEEHPISVGKP
ncbi:hypothetical protein [Herbaspirillum sp. YR522]|uniref:hypothetical protein n=1 Tax=Herbaspirillum sp. YR522 TaxID=1144342 RepID=UPI00026FBC89|nr:hypothetical protein [Herbaspirillum sp. YR522]EJM97763.1 hypothetical protein PMI40_04245 [Herbaspirillum sp. YR522]